MFTVANIRSDDAATIAEVTEFLAGNPDPGVRLRSSEAMDRAIDAGQGVVVRRDGAVRGCSLIHKYPPPDGGPVFSEIGTMRVVDNGLGLQVMLAKIHLLQIRIEEDGGEAAVFAVAAEGSASLHNLSNRVGMEPWRVPADLARMRREAGVPFAEGKPVLVAGAFAFASAVRHLGGWHLGGRSFATPKGDARVELAMGWFVPEQLRLEAGA